MKKTNFTIHSLTRVAHWCMSLLLMFALSSQASAQTCNLVCNDHVNASMPADICERTFTYADFLNNPDPNCPYVVELSHPYGTTSSPANFVNRTHLGYTFVYSVKDPATGNSCWGYVTIEDKAAPVITAKNRKISCFQLSVIEEELGNVVDNCQGGKAKLTSLTIAIQGNGCDQEFIAKVYREIISWDQWGNTTTAKDTLSIVRDSIKNVKCPDLVELDCEETCVKGSVTTVYTFSKDPASSSYPHASLLMKIKDDCPSIMQVAGAPGHEKSRVVPMIGDSVVKFVNGVCTTTWDSTYLWSKDGAVVQGACKTTVGYTDEIIPICGAGFKIRRQWRITNWCDNRDTVCVQWIKVEDKFPPVITGKDLTGIAGAHDCYASIKTVATATDKCEGAITPKFIFTATDASGKPIIVNGTAGDVLKVAANPYGICPTITYYASDKCGNQAVKVTNTICVTDVTPPTPVCDEFTRTTVDPATCWARVYAHDLDNGSRDNCCNVLHFAVAHMDTITATRTKWTSYWNTNCKADYWKYKSGWDYWLEEYINCFIFKDYIDLTECGENQVVLRVYEACGVPRYDPHVFPCSEHDWFTYNTYTLCRRWHNYQFHHSKGAKSCTAIPAPVCKPYDWTITDVEWNTEPKYVGASIYAGSCLFASAEAANKSLPVPPGNRCSERLYNDCMINITVDDKTLPVCESPKDIYWYCDNAGGGGIDRTYEYAGRTCKDESYTNNGGDNIADYTCRDKDDKPYNQIECVKENDGTDDTLDPTGREFGYYGCGTVTGHEDEHGGPTNPCDDNDYRHALTAANGSSDAQIEANLAQVFKGYSTWAPVYCHSWLCADKWDAAGKVDAKSAFWSPELHNLGPNGPIAKAAATGKTAFKVWDNCWINTDYTSEDKQYVDQCGNGWLSRTWTFKDKCVGTITCTQKIYTYHRSDFEVMFPQDLTLNCDAVGGTSPDGPAGRPMIWDDECELVGVNFEDVRYDIIPDACYKIVRTWKLIDWCKYDPNAQRRYPDVIWDDRGIAGEARPCVFTKLKDNGDGYMTYTQIIKVIDTEAPTTVKCKDTTICINTGYGGAGAETDPMCSLPSYNSDPFAATDNCTPANLIEFRWELDANNDGSIDKKSGAKRTNFKSSEVSASGLPVGVHKLYVISEDNCSNEDTTYCLITVKDCKKPTPYCFNGIATVVMPTTQSVIVWAKDLDAGSYDNCTKRADLKLTFGSNGQASDTFSCADIANGIEQQVTVDIWVEDATGNKDYCRTYLLIQDGSGNACDDKSAVAGTIAGKVATETTEPVENVLLEVKATSNGIPSFKTDAKGSYAFANLDMKGDYSITPKRDDDPSNGVSTIDLVLIQKHILGVQPLNSAYKVIAADADRSNDVSAVDLVELRKLILTVYDKLPNNTSWRFVPKSYNFSNITTPWGFPEKLDVKGLSKDELNRDFVGVKVGDVNATAVAHSLLGAEARSGGQTLKFTTLERELKAGEEAVIEFTSANFNGIEGYQFSLAMKGLDLKSVQSGVLKVSESNFGVTKLGQGYVTTSWNESKGITAGANDVLFSIKVKATKATTLSEALVINSKYTRAEAYNNSEALNVSLEVGNKKSAAGYALYQNTPNPFKATTVIGYELAKSGAVTMRITDVTGKLVRMYNQDGVKGYNQFKVNRSDISGAGVLYYTIETKDFSATKKMIVVE